MSPDPSTFLQTVGAQAEAGAIKDYSQNPQYHEYRDLARSFMKALHEECGKLLPVGGSLIVWGIVDWYVFPLLFWSEDWMLITAMCLLQYFPISMLVEFHRLLRVFQISYALNQLCNEAESQSIEQSMDLQYLIGKIEMEGQVFHQLTGKTPNEKPV